MILKNIMGKRLRSARERTVYSQKQLGIAAGFDKFSASPRINHYEQGRHQPDFATVTRLAKLLKIPASYIYTEDDGLSELILGYAQLSRVNKQKILKQVKSLMK